MIKPARLRTSAFWGDGLELHVVEIMEDLHIAQALAVDLRRMEYALGHPDQALPIEIRPIPLWVKGMG